MIYIALKEFLKPDWRKIVIFIIFFIITFFSIQKCAPSGFSYNLILAPFYFYTPSVVRFYSNCETNFIPLIFSFIHWYLLSCLIVWVYEKIKGSVETIDDYDKVKQIMETRKRFGGTDARIKLKSLESTMKKKKDTEED